MPAASAQESNLYTVENLLVRGVGTGSEAARKRAFELAQIAALRDVVGRVTQARDRAELPLPSASDISKMVASLDVLDERMNEQTYVGLMTFRFDPDAITNYLAGADISFAVSQAKPLLVVPILAVNGQRLLWEPQNVWATAWRDERFLEGLQPILIPDGTAQDRSDFQVSSLNRNNVAEKSRALALRYGANAVLLSEARLEVNGAGQILAAEILVNRTGGSLGPAQYTHREDARAGDRPLDVLQRAAQAVTARYTEAWKAASSIEGSEITTLTFETENDTLEAWLTLEAELLGVGIVEGLELLSLGNGQVVADLSFRGRLDQLIPVLAQRRLELIPAGTRFYLAKR